MAFQSDSTLLDQMDLNDQGLTRRKAFLEFGDEDIRALEGLNTVAKEYAGSVIDDMYGHFLAHDETRAFFKNAATLARVKELQREYFLRLTKGDYGRDYVLNRVNVGLVHQRINLGVQWYLGAYNFYLRAVMKRLFEGAEPRSRGIVETLASLMKLVFLDISLAMQTYVTTIEQQQEAIRELSTPVLVVRPRVLLLPIIGMIDSRRAAQLTSSLLDAIRVNRARVAVMDVTGVAAIDSKVANHLLQTVAAAGLMGATVVVTGLSADVAQSLVSLGVDLSKLNTAGDLQRGLEEAGRLVDDKELSQKQRAGIAEAAA